ncbi:MAG: RHS domain-containing protein [Nitrospirae bacterium]|nr:RHS domain-containing protein [Nitrospirota bacterium]
MKTKNKTKNLVSLCIFFIALMFFMSVDSAIAAYYDFGEVNIGGTSGAWFTFTNTLPNTFVEVYPELNITGSNYYDFTIDFDDCSGNVLYYGDVCEFHIEFSPLPLPAYANPLRTAYVIIPAYIYSCDWATGCYRTNIYAGGELLLLGTGITSQYELTVTTSTGTGTGTVWIEPPGILCDGICTEMHDVGTAVVLEAIPDEKSEFSGWENCGGMEAGTICEVTINAEIPPVAAIFNLKPKLNVNVEGFGVRGWGTVTSIPEGIDCGSSGGACEAIFASNTQVTLTAKRDINSAFTEWSDNCDIAEDIYTETGDIEHICTIILTEDITITARFDDAMEVPTGQTSYIDYLPMVSPALNSDPFLARPLALGNIGSPDNGAYIDGNLSLYLSFLQFTGPVDIYLGIQPPAYVYPGLLMIGKNNALQSALEPWRSETIGPIDEGLFGNIPLNAFPPGQYIFYIAVAPAGRMDKYYLWSTEITIGEAELACSPNSTSMGSSANLESGNLYHSQDILSMPHGLSFSIAYNSKDAYTGPLGKRWTHNYNMNITRGFGSLTLMKEDGKRVFFKSNGNVYIPEASSGEHSTLVNNPDGTYNLSTKEGMIYHFDSSGKLASVKDRNANITTLTYSNNDLITIADPTGRSIQLAYSAEHRLIQLQASGSQNMITLAYDATGNLSGVTDSAANAWHYTYDSGGRMLSKIDPAGYSTTYVYDSNGMVTSSYTPSGTKTISYDQAGSMATVTERDGGIWTYKYDPVLNAPLVTTDPLGNRTVKTYDGSNNLLSATEPGGITTTYTYDTAGNMTSAKDAVGKTSTYTYNTFGQVTSATDKEGKKTLYTYDNLGNMTSQTDPSGAATTYQYDSRGNIISVRDANNRITSFAYDQYNNLVTATDPAGGTTTYTYDPAGNMTSQTDPSGNATQFEYNILNQLSRVTDPSGTASSYIYDAKGNRTSVTDANGNTTYYEFNFNNQVVKVTDAAGGVTRYTYGNTGCGSCTGGTDKLTAITDAGGNTTTYEYDILGRLARETDPQGHAMTYSYDAAGNLTTKTDATGITIRYTYDLLKRLTSINYPDPAQNISYTYDTTGKMLTMTDQSGISTYAYDNSNRLIYETKTIDGRGYATSYTYTASGSLSSITYPSGRTVLYDKDTAGRIVKVTETRDSIAHDVITNIAYNPGGAASSITGGNSIMTTKGYDSRGALNSLNIGMLKQLSYTRDDVGNITSITDALDPAKTKTYAYDALYRLTMATGPWGPIRYSYDPVGNRTLETTGAGTTSYTYSANKLISSTGVKPFAFTYDSNGNSISDNQKQYIYNQNQRLIKAVENSKVLGEYAYNGNGQRVKKTVDGKTTYFIYDQTGNLIEEADQEGRPVTDYIYLGSTPIGKVDVRYDVTPPTTAIAVGEPKYQSGGMIYISASAAISLSATDPGENPSGVNYTEYRLNDNALWTRYTAPFSLNGYSEGSHRISYRSIDKAGNIEEPKTLTVTLDIMAPSSSISAGMPQYRRENALYIGGNTPITILASDTGSGVGKIEYAVDNGSYAPYAGPITLSALQDGTHTIKHRATDNVLTTETEKLFTVILDKTPPETAISASDELTDGGVNTVSPKTRFFLGSADAGSGIKEILYRIDNGNWNTYLAGFPLPSVAGEHTIGYKAIDTLGNEETEKTLTVRMIVIDLASGLSLEPVLLAGAWGSTPSTQTAVSNLISILQASGLNYYIPQTEDEFKVSMRNGRFNTYLLVDFKTDGLTDELREAVNYGEGLVYIKTLPNALPSLQEVFGVDFNGMSTNKDLIVNLNESPISSLSTLQSKGKVVKTTITATTAQALGSVTDKKESYPVIIMNQYGRGKAVLFSFDLLNSLDKAKASSLIVNSLNYVVPEERFTRALGDEPIRITLNNSSEPVEIQVTETLPSQTTADSVKPAATQTGNPIQWSLSLSANGKKTLGYWLNLPDMAGDYQIGTELRYSNHGLYRLYGNYSLTITVANSSAELLHQVIAALQAWPVAGDAATHVAAALDYLTLITDHQGITKTEAQLNLSNILSAIKELEQVSADVAAIRLALDELLKIWQAKWNLSVSVVSPVERYRLAYETDARKLEKEVAQSKKPVLVASAGSLSGLMSSTASIEVLYYYHTDHLGTPIMMTDGKGEKVWEGEFLPFGEAYSITGPATNNLRFPGQYYDEETGLHYNWHRDYKPQVGRYIERDGAGFAGGMNLYSYAANNPIGLTDTNGMKIDASKAGRLEYALVTVAGTSRGFVLYDALKSSSNTFTLFETSVGKPEYRESIRTIRLNPNLKVKIHVTQKSGGQCEEKYASLARQLAHEMGHAYGQETGTAYLNDELLNIIDNENPVAKAIGELERIDTWVTYE